MAYTIATIKQRDPSKADGSTEVTVELTGASVPAVRRTYTLGLNVTADTLPSLCTAEMTKLKTSATVLSGLAVNTIVGAPSATPSETPRQVWQGKVARLAMLAASRELEKLAPVKAESAHIAVAAD